MSSIDLANFEPAAECCIDSRVLCDCRNSCLIVMGPILYLVAPRCLATHSKELRQEQLEQSQREAAERDHEEWVKANGIPNHDILVQPRDVEKEMNKARRRAEIRRCYLKLKPTDRTRPLVWLHFILFGIYNSTHH
jgi:hypothetical protein